MSSHMRRFDVNQTPQEGHHAVGGAVDNDNDDNVSINEELDEVDDTVEVDQLEETNEDGDNEDYEYVDSDDEDVGDSGNVNEYDQSSDWMSTDAIVVETIVPDDERVTSNIMTRYELCSLVSMRAQQISKNPTCFVDVTGLHDPSDMALREIYQNKCPFLLKRKVGHGVFELWNPNDMVKPQL